jgi:hypothetical protein
MFRWVYDLTNNSQLLCQWAKRAEQWEEHPPTEILAHFSIHARMRKAILNKRVNRQESEDGRITNQATN